MPDYINRPLPIGQYNWLPFINVLYLLATQYEPFEVRNMTTFSILILIAALSVFTFVHANGESGKIMYLIVRNANLFREPPHYGES